MQPARSIGIYNEGWQLAWVSIVVSLIVLNFYIYCLAQYENSFHIILDDMFSCHMAKFDN